MVGSSYNNIKLQMMIRAVLCCDVLLPLKNNIKLRVKSSNVLLPTPEEQYQALGEEIPMSCYYWKYQVWVKTSDVLLPPQNNIKLRVKSSDVWECSTTILRARVRFRLFVSQAWYRKCQMVDQLRAKERGSGLEGKERDRGGKRTNPTPLSLSLGIVLLLNLGILAAW